MKVLGDNYPKQKVYEKSHIEIYSLYPKLKKKASVRLKGVTHVATHCCS